MPHTKVSMATPGKKKDKPTTLNTDVRTRDRLKIAAVRKQITMREALRQAVMLWTRDIDL